MKTIVMSLTNFPCKTKMNLLTSFRNPLVRTLYLNKNLMKQSGNGIRNNLHQRFSQKLFKLLDYLRSEWVNL